jgi:hypothetical protein
LNESFPGFSGKAVRFPVRGCCDLVTGAAALLWDRDSGAFFYAVIHSKWVTEKSPGKPFILKSVPVSSKKIKGLWLGVTFRAHPLCLSQTDILSPISSIAGLGNSSSFLGWVGGFGMRGMRGIFVGGA